MADDAPDLSSLAVWLSTTNHWMVEVARVGIDGKAARRFRRGGRIIRPADGGRDIDGGNQFGIGRRQLGLRSYAGFHRQMGRLAAGCQRNSEQGDQRQVQIAIHGR